MSARATVLPQVVNSTCTSTAPRPVARPPTGRATVRRARCARRVDYPLCVAACRGPGGSRTGRPRLDGTGRPELGRTAAVRRRSPRTPPRPCRPTDGRRRGAVSRRFVGRSPVPACGPPPVGSDVIRASPRRIVWSESASAAVVNTPTSCTRAVFSLASRTATPRRRGAHLGAGLIPHAVSIVAHDHWDWSGGTSSDVIEGGPTHDRAVARSSTRVTSERRSHENTS